jgi:DNA-binding LacI/PurR family transcriptional regulator
MDSLTSPAPRQAHYRRIADGIRGQILDGTWTPGVQLPATDKLADTWNASYGTVHTALQSLAKEGWLERLDGSGTFVTEFKNRFACAGIYHSIDIFATEESAFSRALHTSLVKQLGALDKETQVFVDSRPEADQRTLLPALTDAIRLRRIQCLVAPTLNGIDAPSLARLRLPSAFTVNPTSPNQVIFDMKSMLRESVRQLANQGCRSAGLISHIIPGNPTELMARFYEFFDEAVREHGLATREEWIRRPAQPTTEFERYGYRAFKALWHLPDRPEGVIVYPDLVARGVISAVLELGVREIPSRMKFVFHRNAFSRPLCPFPATWAVSDVERVAAELIKLIQHQFAGEKTGPVFLDHAFENAGPEI